MLMAVLPKTIHSDTWRYPSASVLETIAEALDLEVPDLLEILADAMRGTREPLLTNAIGFSLPSRTDSAPRATVRRIVQMVEPNEATTMAELGAFFLARRGSNGQSDDS
jgi:hypothetical protein